MGFIPNAMRVNNAEQCFRDRIIRQRTVPLGTDIVDQEFGRTWFFCKCYKGREADCDKAFHEHT